MTKNVIVCLEGIHLAYELRYRVAGESVMSGIEKLSGSHDSALAQAKHLAQNLAFSPNNLTDFTFCGPNGERIPIQVTRERVPG
jgi:hypothetical protein